MQTKRTAYIDLAKGVCIIIVVLIHTGKYVPIPGLAGAIVPLYFALSGFLFKEKYIFSELIIRKTNSLIIPFLFFYLTAYLVFYLLKWMNPALLVTDAKGIMDFWNNRQFFNGPIWFLLALFWCNMFFYFPSKYIKNDFGIIVIVCIIGFIGWYLGHKGVFLPLFFDVGMTCMPFFTMGYFLNKHVFNSHLNDKYNIYFFIILWIISIIIENFLHPRLSLHYNVVEGWSTYVLSFTSTTGLLFLCKMINSVSVVNYMGKYTLIILGVHHMIYRPLIVLFKHFPNLEFGGYTVMVLTLLLSIATIPLLSKFFPYFVAQKNVFTISNKDTDSSHS